MSEHRALLLEGLRQGMIAQIIHLFEVRASAASGGGTDADARFDKGLANCLQAYEAAYKIITERG
jgi:hypothetical protein